ncbi:MAG: hypothetical protein V7696_14910 [Halioglobus sp.]
MTETKLIEARIIRRLLNRAYQSPASRRQMVLAERTIQIVAATACAFVLGSYLQELLWVLLAGGSVLALGSW